MSKWWQLVHHLAVAHWQDWMNELQEPTSALRLSEDSKLPPLHHVLLPSCFSQYPQQSAELHQVCWTHEKKPFCKYAHFITLPNVCEAREREEYTCPLKESIDGMAIVQVKVGACEVPEVVTWNGISIGPFSWLA